ncbi:MAG TPA: hypothetical protein VFT91_07015 [Dehalococcoidia bacterium]|nr:hypothetical protein [Dehalococcoidia bacterium]
MTRDVAGAIHLDVPGAKLWLDVRDFADRASLYRLLEKRAGANRQQA